MKKHQKIIKLKSSKANLDTIKNVCSNVFKQGGTFEVKDREKTFIGMGGGSSILIKMEHNKIYYYDLDKKLWVEFEDLTC